MNTTLDQVIVTEKNGVMTVWAGDTTFATTGTMAYLLTDCCGASVKGSDDAVVCRSCHGEVTPFYGDAAILRNEADLDRFVRSALSVIGLNDRESVDALTVPVITALTAS